MTSYVANRNTKTISNYGLVHRAKAVGILSVASVTLPQLTGKPYVHGKSDSVEECHYEMV
jgi:hypothetical protein